MSPVIGSLHWYSAVYWWLAIAAGMALMSLFYRRKYQRRQQDRRLGDHPIVTRADD